VSARPRVTSALLHFELVIDLVTPVITLAIPSISPFSLTLHRFTQRHLRAGGDDLHVLRRQRERARDDEPLADVRVIVVSDELLPRSTAPRLPAERSSSSFFVLSAFFVSP